MTEMQRQFEEWAITAKDQFGLPFFMIKNEQGKYIDHATEISWQAWQASRAAIVVKLPEPKSSVEAVFAMKVTKSLDDIGVYYE